MGFVRKVMMRGLSVSGFEGDEMDFTSAVRIQHPEQVE